MIPKLQFFCDVGDIDASLFVCLIGWASMYILSSVGLWRDIVERRLCSLRLETMGDEDGVVLGFFRSPSDSVVKLTESR
jgi:hypothetical protein